MLCGACTVLFRAKQRTGINDPAQTYVANLDRRCVCCPNVTRTDAHTYLMPFDLVLCRRHATRGMRHHIGTLLPTLTTRKKASDAIIQFFLRIRTHRRERAQRRGDRVMRINRQRNRSKKC